MAEFLDDPQRLVQRSTLRYFVDRLRDSGQPFNLETTMTYLDAGRTEPAAAWHRRPSAADAYAELESLIIQRLKINLAAEPCPLHVKLLRRAILEQATILSLNYDLILDHALARCPGNDMPENIFQRHSLALLTDEPSPWEIQGAMLKLHGAVNWWRCRNRACPLRDDLIVWPFGSTDLSGAGEEVPLDAPCRRCGHQLSLAIVPPTVKGVFDQVRRLGFIWTRAFKALRAARRIVVVGVSFAFTDYLLRWLVHQARAETEPPSLTIVDVCQESAQRVRGAFGLETASWVSSFTDFLDGGQGVPVRVSENGPAT